MDIRFSRTETWTDVHTGTQRNSTSVYRAADPPPNAEAIAYITARRIGPKLMAYKVTDGRGGKPIAEGLYSLSAAKVAARKHYGSEA